MSKSRRPYPLEYRQRIIELVRAGRSPESLAQEFEPTAPCIRNWVRQAERHTGGRRDVRTRRTDDGRTDRIAAAEARECHAP